MYHYLKWAAFSLFVKRNVRYLVFILVSLIGIYTSDAVYRDVMEYFVATGQKGSLLPLLFVKWAFVAGLTGLLLFSITRLGFGREGKRIAEEKKRSTSSSSAVQDPIMDRLEKFRDKKRLKRKSDLLMERMGKEGKRRSE